jgi:YesN/AraC family two-component response regulator
MSLDDICKQTLLSKSALQKLFKENMTISVMEYFKQIKIKEAKTLIREDNFNFTEISQKLGYNSIHYFSRIFKNETGMTLSEYSNSVKSLID